MAAAGERFQLQEQLDHTLADGYVLHALGMIGLGGLRLLHLTDQLLASFVSTDDRMLGVLGAGVDVQYIFHSDRESGVLLGNPLVLVQMGSLIPGRNLAKYGNSLTIPLVSQHKTKKTHHVSAHTI